jgi:predicted RNA-binding Zn-ribbon protein involved in translation (DUF1610 family)
MPIKITCPSCDGLFQAPESAAGKKAKCPKCGGVIEIPVPVTADAIYEAETSSPRATDGIGVASSAVATAGDAARKPCPKCGEMILQEAIKCRFCGEIFDPMLRTYQRTTARGQNGDANPIFLHIPVSRLIVLSILSLHLYEAYWIYKNWRYVKERDNLSIWPFWRGIFGIFFCHSLLQRMHDDAEARAVEAPSFSPAGLATGWVVLVILGNLIDRLPSMATLLVTALLPSFLCLVPVQKYVNSVAERRDPGEPYYRWSWGHIACIVIGLVGWLGVVAEIVELIAQQ